MKNTHIPLESEFFARCAKQQLIYNGAAEGPYSEFLGDYSGVPLVADRNASMSVEDFMVDRLDERLTEPRNRPVVALDAGGGVGATWLRLASVFKSEVKSGDLKLLVTLLRGTPVQYLQAALAQRQKYGLDMSPIQEGIDLYSKFGRHVGYFNSRFHRGDAFYLTQNGQPMLLDGEVDFVHECNAITGWNKVPEQSILRLGRLVSSKGLYMVFQPDIGGTYGAVYPNGGYDPSEGGHRNRGIKASHALLCEQLGLAQVDVVEAGSEAGKPMTYRIFRGPEALPIGALAE